MKKRDKKQLLPGIVVAAAISFLVFLYAPVDLYCSNISEFWFDFGILIRASSVSYTHLTLPTKLEV